MDRTGINLKLKSWGGFKLLNSNPGVVSNFTLGGFKHPLKFDPTRAYYLAILFYFGIPLFV